MAKSNADRTGYLVARMSYTESDWFGLSETKRAQLVAADMQSKGNLWVALGPDRYNTMLNQIRDQHNQLASVQSQLRTAQEANRQLTSQIEYNAIEYNRHVRDLEGRLSQLITIIQATIHTIGAVVPTSSKPSLESLVRKNAYFSNSR
jgi:hypothetical protein